MLLFELPQEVVFHHVFPFLHLNDLLRLRRVSQNTKLMADDFLRLHVASDRYIYIWPEENLSAFLSLNISVPVSRFCIANKNNKTWEHEQWQTFAQLYGNKITHLKISSMDIPIVSRKAAAFFELLPNLEYLAIEKVSIRGLHSKRQPIITRVDQEFLIPSPFRRLATLKISNYDCFPDLASVELVWKFITECSSRLEFVQYPRIECLWSDMINQTDLGNVPRDRFGSIKSIIEGQYLKYVDLCEYLENGENSPSAEKFYQLVTVCAKYNVKLLNVDASLIESMMNFESWDMEEHGNKLSKVIVSLHYMHKSSFLLELPLLEKILIAEDHGTTTHCSMPHWKFKRPSWSNLKYLEIWIDSAVLWKEQEEPIVESSKLLNFFFVGIKREKLENLTLYFFHNYYHRDDIIPHPRMRNVCSSCPNLRKLTIGYWPGSNKEISKLWGNLPLLEDLTFESCKNLGNVAFIGGKDHSNPSLLKMKNLKRLKLDGLQKMPRITDTLFSVVLARMPLEELYLGSSVSPVKSITVSGIRSLLTGVFAKTIQKFLLMGYLELENVTSDELIALENEFRSSKML